MGEETKSHRIRVADIPQDAKVMLTQNSKPYLSMAILIALGLGLVYYKQTRIYGIILIAAVCLLLYYSKNRKLLLVTDKFIVAYDEDGENCRIYYFDEVVEWSLNHVNGIDSVVLAFADGTTTSVPAIYIFPVSRALRKIMPGKEKVYLKHIDLIDHSKDKKRVKKKKWGK